METVLIVDDTPDNIDLLRAVLQDDYKIKAALNGERALKIATSGNPPDIILLDVMMPEMDGYEVCQRLKANPVTAHIPVIFVTAKNQIEDEKYGFSLGAVDYITKPISPPIVQARIRTQLDLYLQQRNLEGMVRERTSELEVTRLEIIMSLGRASEFKDMETAMHVVRIGWYSRVIARRLGAADEWCELIFNAAPMHDIGKIGIPDAVLLKPGKFEPHEWEVMKKHSEYGAAILGSHDTPMINMAREIAMYHHEKWDGNGYPEGLSGEDIPLSARIVALADVYDALSTERPYKKPWPEEKVLALIKDGAGNHFDPNIVPVFFDCLDEIKAIQLQFPDEDMVEHMGVEVKEK